MIRALLSRLRGRGGIREVAKVAFPLVIAAIGHGVNLFTDRVMLANYSSDAMAAAFPAGLSAFTLACIFLGTIGYAGVFVAQYTGAGQPLNVGKTVWQAIFLALIGGAFNLAAAFFAEEIFLWFGHDDSLIGMEAEYFAILAGGGVTLLLSTALSTFWSGRAKTKVIMAVNLIVTLFNIPLNALFIFGTSFTLMGAKIEFPEMGIAGAAWGTLITGMIGMFIYMIGFFLPSARRRYGTGSNPFSPDIFRRLIRFGLPNGIQLVLELSTFNIFVVLLGKLGVDVLTASTVVMSAYTLAFNPMIGFGQAASILVGQAIGAKEIPCAKKAVGNCFLLLLIGCAAMGVIFVGFPEVIFTLFDLQSAHVRHLSRIMLIFTTFYLLFDALNVLFVNAIKGAGDTRFAMVSGILLGWAAYAMPCLAAYWLLSGDRAAEYFGREAANSICVWTLWGISEAYICLLGLTYLIRYLRGKWQDMSVIS